ncbi:MAG: single-stranded-DNA-specific exonuclease RecJ [Candidatus Omnitrophica bacterium]|nr:single-stranded-DNA-specific exonuclease RecJ [Candidatus Omnitrophota bacterium]MDD5437486.1 single-stranded-DNA-specific exonuclease RecJ [Candidatus Omnitrophota bacterium]
MQKIWRIRDCDPEIQNHLSAALNISKVTAQLLVNRGIRTADIAHDFLKCSLGSCHNPFLLKDMEKAVLRIRQAISKSEHILVYGDYDVDGMTSVTLLYSALKNLGANVETYIPNRIEEGYGLNLQAIRKAHKSGVKLIISVDCGITSFKEVEQGLALNIDIIITDHHEILNSKVPAAYAVINPLQGDCRYPFKHLAGVGLAYKLVKALYDGTPHFAEDFLDLVSLGTVADIAPLVGENRVLAKHGLDELNRRERVGLRALMDAANLEGNISAGHIGFVLGPRINAMGRIGSPEKAVELLLSSDLASAADLAKILGTENRNRQKIEARILEEALARVEREVNFTHHKVIVLASENWHPGVIGIVASRIADRFYRPAILISLDGKLGKGSGRSIDGFHLFEYLLRCKDLLAGFGGHESACGITIEKERIGEFTDLINKEAFKDAKEEIFSPKLDIEMDIPLSSLSEGVIREIESLAPFGPDNPRPVLSSRRVYIKDAPRKIGKSGFKFWVTDDNISCEAIAFTKGDLEMPKPGSEVDLAYIPSINNWQGVQSIQLELKDIK